MEIENIIEGCKQKNRRAEKSLFKIFSPSVLSICLRYSTDNAQAKDYLQECFIHVFQKIDKYDKNRGAFKPWMHRLSVNKILEIKRKNKPSKEFSTNHFPDTPVSEDDFDYLSEAELLSAIRRLPDGYRNVLNLFVFENFSHADIAKLLGISESSSRSQYSRAKALLKKILTQSIPNIHEKRLV